MLEKRAYSQIFALPDFRNLALHIEGVNMSIKGTGRRGPPGKSPHLKLISGTDRGDRMMPEIIRLADEDPERPDYLSADAMIEWGKAIVILKRSGLLSVADSAIIAAYCVAKCTFQNATIMINSSGEFGGLLIQGTAGANIPNPLIAIRRHAMNDMVSYAIQMGMTPAARLRLNAEVSSKKKENPFDALKDD